MKWYHFWVEFIFGVAILAWPKISIFLLFVYVVIRFTLVYEALRKMIRIYQIGNELKLLTMMKKLKVKQGDIEAEWEKHQKTLSEEAKEQIQKDLEGMVMG